MLYTPPRSTFHQIHLLGLLCPISFVAMQVLMSPSTALSAFGLKPVCTLVLSCVALLFNDRSSIEMKSSNHSQIYLHVIILHDLESWNKNLRYLLSYHYFILFLYQYTETQQMLNIRGFFFKKLADKLDWQRTICMIPAKLFRF